VGDILPQGVPPTQHPSVRPVDVPYPPAGTVPLAGRTLCFVDFEAETTKSGTFPVEAGISVDGLEKRIVWAAGAKMILYGLKRTGRDMKAFRADCRTIGLPDLEAAEVFRQSVPDGAVIVHYGAGTDTACLRRIYPDGDVHVCDAAVFLPRRYMGVSPKGKPMFQPMRLQEHAALSGVVASAGEYHMAVADARVLRAIVEMRDLGGWLARPLSRT
jgi:hypothetical protein